MGTLYIVSTPIGNIEDLTIRAIKTLMSVPVIACEDTRVTGQLRKLIKDHFLSVAVLNTGSHPVSEHPEPLFISCRDENEELKSTEIIQAIESGKDVALVSDAGTPLISDPGFKLIGACIKRNIAITAVPGPTSIIAASTLSGLPTQPFWYFGYLPEKEGKRLKLLNEVRGFMIPDSPADRRDSSFEKQKTNSGSRLRPTLCFFASPHRLSNELTDIKKVFGDIDIVIARELTKLHEEIYRGKVSDALIHFSSPKGEFVILFQI